MTKKKKIIIGLVAGTLAAIGAVGFFLSKKKSQTEYLTQAVQRGVVSREVSVTGTLVSQEEINLNFETAGRVKKIDAYVGREVVKGEVLATIDDGILSGEAEKARLAWEKALADSGGNADAVREAEQAVKNAERYLEEIEKLDSDKENSAQQALEAADKYYQDALAYYEQVVDDNGVDSSQAKSAKMSLTTAENSQDSAEKNLEVVKKTSDLNQVSAKGSLDSAKDKLRTVRSENAQIGRAHV